MSDEQATLDPQNADDWPAMDDAVLEASEPPKKKRPLSNWLMYGGAALGIGVIGWMALDMMSVPETPSMTVLSAGTGGGRPAAVSPAFLTLGGSPGRTAPPIPPGVDSGDEAVGASGKGLDLGAPTVEADRPRPASSMDRLGTDTSIPTWFKQGQEEIKRALGDLSRAVREMSVDIAAQRTEIEALKTVVAKRPASPAVATSSEPSIAVADAAAKTKTDAAGKKPEKKTEKKVDPPLTDAQRIALLEKKVDELTKERDRLKQTTATLKKRRVPPFSGWRIVGLTDRVVVLANGGAQRMLMKGDTFKGAKIVKIDAKRGVVKTTKGDIRMAKG